ncbi:hypothetical protein [Massilia sp. PWRC2]|uniref:hypothetical protein n=1 Tax=Massilia sp. PWRC2 TaxID=2804626 RepID=UPI003CF2588D
MHTKSLIAAAAFAIIASPAFAADAGQSASAAPVSSAAAISATAQALNLPSVNGMTSVNVPASRSRADVHAEAVDFVAHYKTMLEVQLELAKN